MIFDFRGDPDTMTELRLVLLCTLALLARRAGACYEVANQKLAIGDKTWVCVTIGAYTSDGVFNYTRSAFQPDMDDFTRLKISGSWSSASYSSDTLVSELGGEELYMHVESEGSYSFQKLYRTKLSNNIQVTFPLAVAVISLKKGKVDGITWDTGCFDCDSSECTENQYRYDGTEFKDTSPECYKLDSKCTSSKCDLTVYVVWTGTDKDGNFLLSQQKRLSNFQIGSLSP